MGLLKEKDRKEVAGILKDLPGNVRFVFFTQDFECEGCEITHGLLGELTTLSDRLSLEVHDFVKEKAIADGYGIDKIPAFAIVGDRDRGIRYYGIPGGYEFASLLSDIRMVAEGDSGLDAPTRAALGGIGEKVHIQVFVTPT